jgi:hypothetical protein
MIKRMISAVVGIVVIGAVFVGFEWIFVPSFGGYVGGGTLSAYVECSGAFLDHHGTAVTAVATIVIAAFTGTLWFATIQSTELARESFTADKRPFVFAMGLNGFWEREKTTGQYNWRFRPLWQNSGDTPSKNLRIHTGCELRNAPLPVGFNFNQAREGTGLLPPKAPLSGGLAPESQQAAITPQDILDLQAGRKFLYVWGWAKYRDVFPGTKERVTHFCWLVTPVGNPLEYVPGSQPPAPGGLAFHTIHHAEGNCADEECG